jgi:hypothetical protein
MCADAGKAVTDNIAKSNPMIAIFFIFVIKLIHPLSSKACAKCPILFVKERYSFRQEV